MKIINKITAISLLLFLLIGLEVSAVNIFLWDNDNDRGFRHPDNNEYTGASQMLTEAVREAGYSFVSGTDLPANLNTYDIVVVSLGQWCRSCGDTPPGSVGSDDKNALINYLRTGKSLYIEGVDFANEHSNTGFLDYFGCSFDGLGGNRSVQKLLGQDSTVFAENLSMYSYGTDLDYKVSKLRNTTGKTLMISQDSVPRIIGNIDNSLNYRTIISSVIIGGISNNNGNQTRASLMKKYLNFLSNSSNPKIETSFEKLDFKTIYIGYSDTMKLVVQNLGGSDLMISNIVSSSPHFTIAGDTQFTLESLETKAIKVVASPTSVGNLTANLTIHNNTPNNAEESISLLAVSERAPRASLQSGSINAYISDNIIDSTYKITLSNIGDNVLNYNAVTKEINSIASRDFGGPDNYGYKWRSSTEVDGPRYEWNDISTLGTSVSIHSASLSIPLNLGFDFPYYGRSYSSVKISSYGYLTFDNDGNTNQQTPLPNLSFPNSILAFFWGYLRVTDSSSVHYYRDEANSRFIVQMKNYDNNPYNPSHLSCQVMFYENGIIEYHYKSVDQLRYVSVGIENHLGDDGLNVPLSAIGANKALRFYYGPKWLTIKNNSGNIASGGSEDLTLALDARGIDNGIYNAKVVITTNDPMNKKVTIPVTLTITDANTSTVTVNLSASGDNDFSGSDVKLVNRDGIPSHVYRAFSNQAGRIVFNWTLHGDYDLIVHSPNFRDYRQNNISISANRNINVSLISNSSVDVTTPEHLTSLNSVYPNPFNPTTKVSFSLKENQNVDISVYNVLGQKVKTLLKGELAQGDHEILWNGLNNNGSNVASGIYFFRMKTKANIFIKKSLLLK